MVVEEEPEEQINPKLIAELVEITTLGKLTMQFGSEFSPPGDLDQTSGLLEVAM